MKVDHGLSINDPIVLRDQAELEYRSRVEGIGDRSLTVARPLDLMADHDPDLGTDLLVTWGTERGIAVVPVRLIASYAEGHLRLWSMAPLGAGWVEQRRRFVRVPASGVATLTPLAEESEGPVKVILLDVSEGALRCTVDVAAAADLGYDDGVTAGFRFGEGEFAIPARVAFRRPNARPGKVDLVVIFDEPVKDADSLRKQIFDRQRRSIRAKTTGRLGH